MLGRKAGLSIALLALACIALMASDAEQANAGEIKTFSMTPSSTQAGAHPNVTISTSLSSRIDTQTPCSCSDPEVLNFHFPTGFIGNPHAIPKCSLAELSTQKCPPDSQIGTAVTLKLAQQPMYNMETRPDEAGLIAANLPVLGTAVFIVLKGRTDSDYGLDSTTAGIVHALPLVDLTIHLWGVPTDTSNDKYRAPLDNQGGCLSPKIYPVPCFTDPVKATSPPKPYLQNPTACETPLVSSLDVEYYDGTSDHAEHQWPETTGCDLLSFNPSLTAQLTAGRADSPAGIDINVKVPQTQSATVPSPSELRKLEVTLPSGVSLNPNAADGKTVCTDGQAGFGTVGPARCPESSKIGTLKLDVSALPAPIPGALYLGEPQPGNRYRMFFTASGFATHVKLSGSVRLDPHTGRITTVFEDLPQSPLQEFDMHIFGSERGLLATPERCGTYTVESEFVPWAAVLGAQRLTTSIEINEGSNGDPCPLGQRPLDPVLSAGSSDNTAGVHSPFSLAIDRGDGRQNLVGVDVVNPPGFSASLRGIPYCPESAIQGLSDSNHSGLSEQAAPSCPTASLIGSAVASNGAGSKPLYVSGKVYLAGPYKGSPLSLLVVVPAISGPYDLGNVVVRAAIDVDSRTAQVAVRSDPIPQIVGGIPLRTRSIQVDLDRPDFTLNPTNCDPFSVSTSISGDEGGLASPSAHFQVANCGVLPFSPKLSLKLQGSIKRRGHPVLQATLRTTPSEANISSAVVALPVSVLLDNGSINNVCTRVQFAADACPPRSVYGEAEATSPLLDQPLSGAVYLRSSDNELPDLVVALRGQFDVDLVGRIDTPESGGIRTSFEGIPDVPVSGFTLRMRGGRSGLLENSENLCKFPRRAAIQIGGQNGLKVTSRPRLRAKCSSRSSKLKRSGQRVDRSKMARRAWSAARGVAK
jgi:hypothetical protein